ncbi:MAG: ISNCY family transposase [Spirochaetaceae bacterium]|nr:ISNCY family transposase [Spirochaetaceae bacterium]
MERGKLGTLVDCLSVEVDKLPMRPEYPASKYSNRDAVNSAFGALFFQFPSLLRYMREMEEQEKRSNVQSLFDVKGIPSDNQIRNVVDGIEPSSLSAVFTETLKATEPSGVIKEYRVLDGGVLVAIDGLWYFSSGNIHCPHCLTKRVKDKEGEEQVVYYHAAVAGAVVKPGCTRVLPLAPEIIRNTDGEKKQDCDLAAGKRWLEAHGSAYEWLKPTLMGDDLYSNRPFCEKIVEMGWSFIFSCREESHQWLMETLRNSYMHEIRDIKWDAHKKKHMVYTWKYLNAVPIRYDQKDEFVVNYFSYEIRVEGAKKPNYSNSWITNKAITDINVAYLAECGRARWKIENEHHNVLKNRGYNLEHNFGHGSSHAADIFFLLNLLALQFHTILEYCDLEYQLTYSIFPARVAFFEALRVLIRRSYFASWSKFLQYVRGKDEGPS